jgi:hypothetical protein
MPAEYEVLLEEQGMFGFFKSLLSCVLSLPGTKQAK